MLWHGVDSHPIHKDIFWYCENLFPLLLFSSNKLFLSQGIESRVSKMGSSVTRWLDYLFNIWPLLTVKIGIKELPKGVQKLDKHQINPCKIVRKVAKFRPIWSHWWEVTLITRLLGKLQFIVTRNFSCWGTYLSTENLFLT